jgi:hypothetical protein
VSKYDPRSAMRPAIKGLRRYVEKHTPASERTLHLSTADRPTPCAVLLRSLTDNGPVPDDFTAIPKTAAGFKAHVRPDGAVYKGAFELQGQRGSVVLVWGPADMTVQRAEQVATIERRALEKRHESSTLGVFAANPSTNAVKRRD